MKQKKNKLNKKLAESEVERKKNIGTQENIDR